MRWLFHLPDIFTRLPWSCWLFYDWCLGMVLQVWTNNFIRCHWAKNTYFKTPNA